MKKITYKRSVKTSLNKRGYKNPPLKCGKPQTSSYNPKLFGITWG